LEGACLRAVKKRKSQGGLCGGGDSLRRVHGDGETTARAVSQIFELPLRHVSKRDRRGGALKVTGEKGKTRKQLGTEPKNQTTVHRVTPKFFEKKAEMEEPRKGVGKKAIDVCKTERLKGGLTREIWWGLGGDIMKRLDDLQIGKNGRQNERLKRPRSQDKDLGGREEEGK